MRFSRLIVRNFFRVKHIELDLSCPGVTLIEGRNLDVGKSNEAGKSTIFMALCWCLYGRYPGGAARPGNEIVNPLVRADCSVEVTVIDDTGELATIRRTRMEGPKHTEAKLYVSSRGKVEEFDQRQQDTSASTQWVAEFLGMDYEMFLKHRYFAQEDIAPITRMKPTALKQFCLENLLHVEWTDLALARAKNEMGRLEAKLAKNLVENTAKREMLQSRVRTILSLRGKSKDWRAKEEEKKVALRAELAELVEMLDGAKKANQKIDKAVAVIEKKYKKEETILEKNIKALPEIDDLDGEIEEKEGQIRKLIAQKSGFSAAILRLRERIVQLEGKTKDIKSHIGEKCENCGTLITKKHIPFMVQEYTFELRTKEASLDENIERETEVANTIRDLDSKVVKLKERRESRKSIREARTQLLVEKAQLAGKKAAEIKDAEHNRFDIPLIEKEISRIAGEIARPPIDPYIGMVGDEKSECQKIASGIRELSWQKMVIEKDLEISRHWAKAFAGTLQYWLLDDITPILNRLVAGYMLDLSNGRISVKLSTVQKKKDGDYREQFGIIVNNMDGGSTFTSLSGGAKSRVDLAVSLAISDFQRAISEKRLDFIVLDELLVHLDSLWKRRFYEMIKKRFPGLCVFIITHEEIDYSLVDRVIVVEKYKGVSRIAQ